MGGFWVDYNLMSSIEGLFVLGEANYSVHGVNRLGANALLQCLTDGYFISPKTITSWLVNNDDIDNIKVNEACKEALSSVEKKINKLLSKNGDKTVDYFHRKLGDIMISKCGISRNKKDLKLALKEIDLLDKDFQSNAKIPGSKSGLNLELEKALRLGDFLNYQIFMVKMQLKEKNHVELILEKNIKPKKVKLPEMMIFSHIAVWEYNLKNDSHIRHSEKLSFKKINLNTRNYK